VIDDLDFDIHKQVSVHELPGEAGRKELQEFLEARFSEPIKRDRPLWQTYILEGNDFSAVMTRFHHAIADGTALARVLIEMTTDAPDDDLDLPEIPEGTVMSRLFHPRARLRTALEGKLAPGGDRP